MSATGITYYKRRILVDKENMVAVMLLLYAKSGRLLKVMEQKEIKSFGNRMYPTLIIIEDKKRRDSQTIVEFKINSPITSIVIAYFFLNLFDMH